MIENNGLGNGRTSVGTFHKQSPISVKKLALRDVQNDNRNSICNQQESSCLLERGSKAGTVKVSGAKRLVPDCPSSPPRHLSLSSNFANGDLELSKRRNQATVDRSANFVQSTQQLSKLIGTPQRQGHNTSTLTPMASQITFKSEVSHPGDLQGSSDQQRMERFLRLQKFLKHCDETDPKDYIQMLLYLSPTELNRHAIELEYRSIQLSIEEGKEIQRTMALNVLGKSAQTNSSLVPSQRVQAKK